ncbi:PDZ domain-containing protein [Rhodocytophaga rosea]|uniref:PDZ domain-containing protein n=2 Tax=Rhodocytophaga rosea TaxID=2704465 RepID=A0A6C0GV98_9BACT|nr:PDZ domain-containing protein [Rhodocytophaga rosea]
MADNGKPVKNLYQFSVDLTRVKNDKITVELVAPEMNKKEVVYYMPKIVPGTYANYNFGRFVSDFTARDKKGKVLPVEKLDENSWKIKDANKLSRISYTVEDTWDTDQEKDFVFEPGGTNIEENTNFVINTHGFFGYFDDLKRANYQVSITKPQGFYGSTSLTTTKTSKDQDTYVINSYNDLVDAPMMYNKPDTTILKVGGADILVSVYSPNKMASSKEIATNINEVLEAQKEYLGGELPIKKYAFLIYLFDKPTKSGSMGALEHSYSSMYTLPEASSDRLAQTVRDVAAHEFFHIVTPLSIHSEEIHNFDFNTPQMSKHLWLYEGVTEYFAGHMQVKHGLIDLAQYADMIVDKLFQAEQFNDTLPFTVMSKNALELHKDQYQNVYAKGALIGVCLDIKLRELSGGKYGMQNLMKDLAKTYGKEKAFKDEELFDQIAKLTYPEIRTFFSRYVEGNESLPLEEMLGKVGISYKASEKVKGVTLGNIGINFNPESSRLVVSSVAQMNDFGKTIGFQEGDEFISFNGTKLTTENIQEIITQYITTAKEGDNLEIVVARKDEKGKEVEKKLAAKVVETEKEQRHVLQPLETPTPEQAALQQAWLKP